MAIFQKSVVEKFLSELEEIVYELYDLTEDEIKIVEES